MWTRHKQVKSPTLLFGYDPTRKGFVPVELLSGFRGYLQVDGYDGYSRAKELPTWENSFQNL